MTSQPPYLPVALPTYRPTTPGVTEAEMERVVIAYEPVWAIGTGLTCPPEKAQVHMRNRAIEQ